MSTTPEMLQIPSDADTFPKLLRRCVSRHASRPAMREKEFGIWNSWTWQQYYDEVEKFAGGLAARGVRKGDKVMLIGHNRPRLYWAMAAAQVLGAVPIPTYADSVAEEMQYVIEHAEATVVVVQDQEQVDKLLEVKARCPLVRLVIYDEERGMRGYDKDFVASFTNIQQQGEAHLEQHPGFVTDAIDATGRDDISVILYTSGTTGRPKGVVLSHYNVISIATECTQIEGLNETDSVIAYLPMAWVVDYFISYAQALITGYCVCCPESPDTLMHDTVEIGPTYHFTSPRVLENHRTNIMIRMEDASALKRNMFHYFLKVAEEVGIDINENKPVPFKQRVLYQLGRLMVYEPLKNVLGYSRTRLTYTAGEAIGPDMFNFYRALGIHVKQVYGQTEASPFLTVQPNDAVRPDTVGVALKQVQLKLSDDGEVLFKSPGNFIEYYKNDEATRATKSEDGWVSTGDTGFFDEKGQLKIIDRTKDVGRLSSGELFAPKYIENKLKFFPQILEAVCFGHERQYVTAMINIDLGAVGDWAERRGLAYASYQELAAHEDVYDVIAECVEQVNQDLAEDDQLAASQVRRFLVLHKELDADDGELTRTRKVRRRTIAERYEPIIHAFYADAEHVQVETEVTFEDGRKGAISGDLKIRDVQTFGSRVAKVGAAAAQTLNPAQSQTDQASSAAPGQH